MSGCKYFTSHNHGVTKKKCVHSSLSTGNYFDSNSSAAVPNEVSRPFQYCARLPSSGRTADSIADKQVDIWSHFFLTEQIFAKKRLIWEEKHAHFIYVYIYLLKKKKFYFTTKTLEWQFAHEHSMTPQQKHLSYKTNMRALCWNAPY